MGWVTGLAAGLAAGLGWLTVVPAARAGLSWATQAVAVPAGYDGAALEARYAFRNDGPQAVEIREVRTSCGCTVAELAKRRYEPGEAGEIVARFTPGERTGPQHKEIVVDVADQDGPTVLRLTTDIPELVRVTPRFVSWLRGQRIAPRVIELAAPPHGPALASVEVRSDLPHVTAEVRALEAGRRYQLVVTPTRTDALVIASLDILIRFEDHAGVAPRHFKAYAVFKGPPPAADRPEDEKP